MFGLIQLADRTDNRMISPLSPERPKIQIKTNLTKIERLQLRTKSLQAAHKANSAKAINDERKLRDADESAQLMQLSLRMLLDIVDRQHEVASLDLAQSLYGKDSPRKQTEHNNSTPQQQRPTSPVSSAFDLKKSGIHWKEKMLIELEQATSGLLSGLPEDFDDKLLASRRVISIVHQLESESAEAKAMSEGNVRKQINAEHDEFLRLTYNPNCGRELLQTAPSPELSLRLSSPMIRLTRSERSKRSKRSPTLALLPSASAPTIATNAAPMTASLSSSLSPIKSSITSPSSASFHPFHPAMSSTSSMIEVTKLRGDQAILSQKLIHFGEHKSRWSLILCKEMKTIQKKATANIQKFQKTWLSLLFAGQISREWGKRLIIRQEEIAEEKAKVQAVIRMQSMFRGGFTRDLHEKFVKVKEMLLSRLWIIRLNIHTKQRKREAALVRSFLYDYANTNPFKVVVSKFRWKIIWTQRAVRGFLNCKRARMNVLTRKWIKIERVVARKRKQKEEEKIRKAFASMMEGQDEERGGGSSSNGYQNEDGTTKKKKKKKKRQSVSMITGRPRSPSPPKMSRKDQVNNNKAMRKMSRRASFGTTSVLAIQELKKNLQLIEEEERLQTANRLIKAMEDCSTLSKKLDFVKNQKNRQVKMSRALVKKLTSTKDSINKVNPAIRKNILLNLYRKKRANWSGRPPRPSTTKAESLAAAKYLLNSESIARPEELEKAKEAVREPEVWILYSTITRQDMAKMILQGFKEQEVDTKDSAQKFWETLE